MQHDQESSIRCSIWRESNRIKYLGGSRMRVKVDEDLCLGCGICEGLAPEVFSLANEPFAEVLLDPVPEEYEEAVQQSIEECPEEAIIIIEE
jgi:ferredoxin